jgi:acyl-CoA hydrolase
VSYVKVVDNRSNDFLVDGFITFIHVDKHARRIAHRIVIEITEPEDLALQQKAKELQIAKKVKG